MTGRTRRNLVRLLLSLAVLVVLGGCGADEGRGSPGNRDQRAWQRLPDLPLSERQGPVVVSTGRLVLAIGGETGDQCPPDADCSVANTQAADGAKLDLTTREWTAIADAPVPVPAYSTAALVDGEVFVRVEDRLLAYDIAADRWRTIGRKVADRYSPVADGDRLVLINGSDERDGARPDLVYHPEDDAWSELPDDPLGPSYDRGAVSTPAGLVLAAKDLVPNPGGGDQPSYIEAALLPRGEQTWHRFGPSDQLGGGIWGVIGDQVVNVSLDSTDGGGEPPGDYGRQIPFGGILDVARGAWSPLPDPPKYLSGDWNVTAAGWRLIAAEGYLFDVATGSWLEVPRPDGARERPGPAAWANDTLVVVTTLADRDTNAAARDNAVWMWTPVFGARQ